MNTAGAVLVVALLLAVGAGARGTATTSGANPPPTPRDARRIRRPLRGVVRDGLGAARAHGPHQGFDIFPTEGDRTVYAYGDGVVDDIIDGRQSAMQARKRAGLYIDVRGDDGNLHRYLHLDRVFVNKGQRVARDQPIATIAGSHLHFELRDGGRKYGPARVPDFG